MMPAGGVLKYSASGTCFSTVRIMKPDCSDGTEVFIVPASLSQRRLWFLHQFEPESPAYHIPAAVEIDGILNVAALHNALQHLVDRHESLRTCFKDIDGEPCQIIYQEMRLELAFLDLKSLAETTWRSEVEKQARVEALRVFNLNTGPLLRVNLLKVGNEKHVLLITMHHIISDGWSLAIFVRELAALYEAFLNNRPSPLPELPIQYADFSEWQRKGIEEKLLQQLPYWKKQLEDIQPLELPTTYTRPVALTYAGASAEFDLSPNLLLKLKEFCRGEGATLYMALLAAFQALLYRYTGQKDIAIGTVIAGRKRAQTEGVFGFFVNTLVARIRLSPGWKFVNLLKTVKDTMLDAYTYQDVPFEKLVEVVMPARDLARTPLFQVMLVLQNTPQEELRLKGLELRRMKLDYGISKFDITMTLEESGQKLSGTLEYNKDLFDANSIRRMIGHFNTLLAAIVQNPDQRINYLPILSAEERHQMLVEWNRREAQNGFDEPLTKRFEAQARRRPWAPAVSSEEGVLSYGDLDRRSNQLAHYLRRLGVGLEKPVGILMDRSLEMMVGLLGILKGGGIYVPLDPSYPVERLAYMVEDVGVNVLLTNGGQLGPLVGYSGKVVSLDREWKEFTGETEAPVESGVGKQNPMYVIYTSGSTGMPKGVIVPHGAVANHMLWMEREFQIGEEDRFLQKTPLSFDVSAMEVFLPLMVGAELVLARPGGHRDNRYILELVQKRAVTVLYSVSSMLELLVRENSIEDCRSLRYVCGGGEAMPKSVPEELMSRLDVGFCNMYGPTETAIHSTFWRCLGKRDWEAKGLRSIPIGRGIDNTRLYVLDGEMEPVPVGVTGELCIGGAGVARGYWKKPAATAERFVPDPWSGEVGGRLYRTGDWVKWQENGELEYMGRRDEQIKIRGFRIEIGEIENKLGQCEGVTQAVVVVRQDTAAGKRLVGYVTKNGEIKKQDLWQALKRQLPEYMVPSAIVVLDEMPLLPSGKVDRRSLPAPTSNDERRQAAYTAPRTAVEEKLVEIWTEVLGSHRIGVEDNFFDLGGHSLLATRVMARMNDVFHVELPVQKMFENPVISQLAAMIEELQSVNIDETSSISKITRAARKAVILPANAP